MRVNRMDGRGSLGVGWFIALAVGAGLGSVSGATAETIERVEGTALAGVYVVRPAKTSETVHLRLMVQAGEADNPGAEGMAHFVEHLAWLSANPSADRGFDRYSNARVTARSTSYRISGRREDFPELVVRLLRALEPFGLEDRLLLEERDIIQREYQYRFTGKPLVQLHEDLKRRAHGKHPFGQSILGRPMHIESYSLDEARAFHRRTHRPRTAVLVVQGDVSHGALQGLLWRELGPGGGATDTGPPDYTMAPAVRDIQIRNVDGLVRPVLLYRKIVEIPGPEPQPDSGLPELRQQLALLRDVLVSSLPGSLGKSLHFDDFVAESFRLSVGAFDPRHLQIQLVAHPDQGVSLDRLLSTFETVLGKIAEHGIPAETFTRLRQRYVDRLKRRDDPERFAFHEVLRVVELRTGESTRELPEYRAYARTITRGHVASHVVS